MESEEMESEEIESEEIESEEMESEEIESEEIESEEIESEFHIDISKIKNLTCEAVSNEIKNKRNKRIF